MRRRNFIKAMVGTAAATWPLAAGAQVDRKRRVSVILAYAEDNPEARPRIAALVKGLQEFGWIDNRNVEIDYRYSGGDTERTRNHAVELRLVSKSQPVFLPAPTR